MNAFHKGGRYDHWMRKEKNMGGLEAASLLPNRLLLLTERLFPTEYQPEDSGRYWVFMKDTGRFYLAGCTEEMPGRDSPAWRKGGVDS